MASTGLTARPLSVEGSFNWIYLVEFIVDGVLALFFLFYFNRLFATLVAYAIRLYTWHAFRIHIDIEALQISPLAGRIFFKGIRYHGDNETIFVHGGYITWRYWLKSVKECQIFTEEPLEERRDSAANSSASGNDGTDQSLAREASRTKKQSKVQPCRISVKVSGLEAFLYNRSPAYDVVAESLQRNSKTNDESWKQAQATHYTEKHGFEESESRPTKLSSSSDETNVSPQRYDEYPRPKEEPLTSDPDMEKTDERQREDGAQKVEVGATKPATPNSPPAFLRLLPIWVECNKGAVVLGNENSQSIITAKFDSASGEFDASRARPLDLFKILMNFNVEHPYVQMKPNVDYKRPQMSEGVTLKAEQINGGGSTEESANHTGWLGGVFHRLCGWPRKFDRISLWPSHSRESIAVGSKSSSQHAYGRLPQPVRPSDSRWQGLSRYLDDGQQDERKEWESVEYAKSSVLADVKSVGLLFYWEIPGVVPIGSTSGDGHNVKLNNNINCGVPPDYGLDLFVRGGQVIYGPWADRHRVTLQQLFFPASYADSTPASTLEPGETRVSTIFNLCLTIEAETILRVPFRESSKDPKWKGRASGFTRPNQQKARPKSRQRRHSKKSSKSDDAAVGGDVRPFAWFDIKVGPNSTVKYAMDMLAGRSGYENKLQVEVSAINIFSSLNHALLWRSGRVALDCDLSNPLSWNGLRDWLFDISIYSLELFLLRDHTFLMVDLIEDWSSGPLAEFFTFVPFRYLLEVHFQDFKLFLNTNDANIINNSEDLDDNEFIILYGRHLDADLAIPLERFRPALKDIKFDVEALDLGFEMCMPSKNTLSALLLNKDVAQLDSVILHGTYTACSEVRSGLTDTLNLDIIGTAFTISFFGFLARHLAKIKENYFGDNVHFRTLDEYQDLVRNNFAEANDDQGGLRSNDLDVILDICAKDVNILIPVNLYDCTEHVRIRVDTADVDLRVSSYYLELMVNSAPLEFSYASIPIEGDSKEPENSSTQLFLDGVKVFGHRLFGLAPSEPAYVSNWDIEAGEIRGECSSGFLEKFAAAGQCFALAIDDAENAVPVPHALAIYDSTFVRFACPFISLWCHVGEEALQVSTGNIQGSFNDWASGLFSQRLTMNIPNVTVACVDGRAALRHRTGAGLVQTYAYMSTSLSLEMVQRNLHFKEQGRLQRDHIRTHDRKTSRAQFLLGNRVTSAQTRSRQDEQDHVSLPLPSLPVPVNENQGTVARSEERKPMSADQYALGNPKHQSPASLLLRSPNNAPVSEIVDPHAFVDFTGAFKAPHFPLNGLKPDTTDVPQLSASAPLDSMANASADDVLDYDALDEDVVHSSFIVNFDTGISVYCKPEALHMVADLLRRIQPKQPMTMLDSFQIITITEVLSTYSRKKGENSITDLGVKVPQLHVRFVNTFPGDEQQLGEEMRSDKYNIIANRLAVTARLKAVPSRENEVDSNSMHATLGNLTVSAQEGATNIEKDDAALQVVIDDILVWLLDGDRTAIHASFRKTEVAMASRKVEYLAKLIHRTTMLADDFQAEFTLVLAQQEKRLHYLVYKIMSLGESVPDPAFLTRPTYVMRSSPEHIRNSDSWKIISRLRYIYQCLSAEEKAELASACTHDDVHYPLDAEAYVITSLDQWRSWDALLVKESFAMRILYGSTAQVEKLHDRSTVPVTIAIRAERLRLSIDPGPSQNDLRINDLAVRVSITPPPPPSALEVFQEYNDRKMTVIQINNSKSSLRLNWKICSLVDHILTLFEESAPGQHHAGEEILQDPAETKTGVVEKLHIVCASEATVITLETIHLRQVMYCQALKLSVTGEGWKAGDENTSVNAIVSAQTASAEMHGHHRVLWQSSIVMPSLWVAYEKSTVQERVYEALKIAGDSREMVFQLKDEILGVIEVVNSVIGDEAEYIYRLAKAHGSQQPPTSTLVPVAIAPAKAPMRVNVALFLNAYRIEVAILNDLTFTTSGHIARVSVSPDEVLNSTYQIDFDLKAQSYTVLSGLQQGEHVVSVMDVPPINGTIRLLHTDEEVSASAMISVEQITFDGSAVYGLLNALGTTRVTTAIEAIKADILTVQQNLTTKFPGSRAHKTVKPSQISRPVVFDGNVALAGFSISTDAPSTSHASGKLNLLFDLQTFHIRVANRSKNDNVPLPFPEIRVALERISIELREIVDGAYRDCGQLLMGALITCTVDQEPHAVTRRNIRLSISGPRIDTFAETGPTAVDIFSHLQAKMKDIDLSMERKYLRRLRHIDQRHRNKDAQMPPDQPDHKDDLDTFADTEVEGNEMVSSFAFDLQGMQISYIIRDSIPNPVSHDQEDLVLTLKAMSLVARSEAEARLNIEDLQVALTSSEGPWEIRPRNSALLPEVVFNVAHQSTKTERKLAFHAAGKTLDLQLDPQFILPASDVERSMTISGKKLRAASAKLKVAASTGGGFPAQKLLGDRKISSLLVSAEFAGAVVRLQGRRTEDLHKPRIIALHLDHVPQHGRYGQFSDEDVATSATLRAPGIAMKLQYEDRRVDEASLNVEVRIDGSNNVVYPAVVPLIIQISNSVKQVVRDPEPEEPQSDPRVKVEPRPAEPSTLVGADPRAILGKTKLNFGLRICKQEFSLSCQPIAKVAASAKLEDMYITVNTVDSDTGRFFAASAAFTGFNASLRHVYSRESTFSFDIESIVLSLLNSKHLSGVSGISAILKINPTRAQINAKQTQDILLFREIWLPPEIRNTPSAPTSEPSNEPQDYFVQRYKQIVATTAFPWNATIAIAALALDLDLGQAIGKMSFRINKLWASSKKTTSSEQNLCFGIEDVSMTSTGRMSGFIELEKVKVRSSIAWPASGEQAGHTPLIQGSVGFGRLRVKAAFDYQAFAVADITSFEFIMYNVRDRDQKSGDRLVAILDGDKASVYCTASAAALGLSLFQAFERLIQEKEASYEESLRDVEKFLRRKPSTYPTRNVPSVQSALSKSKVEDSTTLPLSLHTDVVVTLRSVDVGAYPSTLLDHQILKAEANDIQARFAATVEENRIHSGLGLTLGQLRVALASVPHPVIPKKLGEITVEDVANNASAARGGIILRVPRVVAAMQTWQGQDSNVIDYIFKSSFEGKIDVGWNYSRISFIRGMWATHTRTLASRLGKPLPESAVKIHGVVQPPQNDSSDAETKPQTSVEQQKITAVVNLPQSNYTYRAMEPPIIVAPQLRDMGEATPPLEWIGLHRDRLPNVTHQIVIVTLLGIAKEVEDAYSRVLGSA